MSLNFPFAPMSPLIRVITIFLLLLPLLLLIIGIVSRQWVIFIPFVFLIIIYASVWLWCRPSHFVISPENLKIVFPVWSRKIPINNITTVRIITQQNFQQEYGWAIRIGVGGLWGGFGWLWTQKQGFLEFYISQTDNFVLIELSQGNNLLLTPENRQKMLQTIKEIISQ